ncbi:MAG: hypothetical protein Q9188_004650 [Gyalolechia gomerana]
MPAGHQHGPFVPSDAPDSHSTRPTTLVKTYSSVSESLHDDQDKSKASWQDFLPPDMNLTDHPTLLWPREFGHPDEYGEQKATSDHSPTPRKADQSSAQLSLPADHPTLLWAREFGHPDEHGEKKVRKFWARKFGHPDKHGEKKVRKLPAREFGHLDEHGEKKATTTDDDEDSTDGHDARMREDPLILAQASVGAIYPDCSQPFDAFIYNTFHRSYAITFEAAKRRANPDNRSRKRQVLRQDGQRSSISIYFNTLYFFFWDLSTIYTFSRYLQRRIFASHSRPPQLITMSSPSNFNNIANIMGSRTMCRLALPRQIHKNEQSRYRNDQEGSATLQLTIGPIKGVRCRPPPPPHGPCNSPSAQSKGVL